MAVVGLLLDQRYRVLAKIGQGGAGAIYLVENVRLNNRWILKAVDPLRPGAQNLAAEVSLLKRLNHPHLPRVVDFFTYKNEQCLIMDYVQGCSLHQLVMRDGPQAVAVVLRWAIQLCDVLGYLHTQEPQEIIYRDLKPGNVMVDLVGNICLIDFGLAGCPDLTAAGTPGYAAPEQYANTGESVGRHTDIYGWGATIYYALTGRRPQLTHASAVDLERMGVPAALARMVAKALQPAPRARYSTVEVLRLDLEYFAWSSGRPCRQEGRG